MEPVSILSVALVISFISAIIGTKLWIRKGRSSEMVWEDMNKFSRPKNVVASGGIAVVLSFALGVFVYIAIRTFLFGQIDEINIQIFSIVSVVLLLAIIGLVDDLLGWHCGGMSIKLRLFMAFFAAVPLMVINAGQSSVTLPFFGSVDFGLLYPLILIPVGIAATTTVYNFLAGFNGLETGQGILVLTFLSYVAYMNNYAWLSIIGLCMVFALLGFWFYNKNPARVFPGDILTYSVGALFGSMAIIGNFEKIAIIVFIPYIIEMVLKVRGKFNLKNGKFPQSFGIPEKDNSLKMPYQKIYSLTHFSIWFLSKFKRKVYENDVVYLIHIIQIVFILIAFVMI